MAAPEAKSVTSKGLLLTPPLNRQKGRGGNSGGKGGWRTYNQAKHSEDFFKKKRFSGGNSNKGYGHQHRQQQQTQAPRERDRCTDKQAFPPPSSSMTTTENKADICDKEVPGKRNNPSTNSSRAVASSSSEHSYDPFRSTHLMPAPRQQLIDKMYEEMLNTAIAANESSVPKGIRTTSACYAYAEEKSFGSFAMTNSTLGNCVMPVLPRIERPLN